MLREIKRFFTVNLNDFFVGLGLCAGTGLVSSIIRMVFNNTLNISFFLWLAVLYAGLLGYSYVGMQMNLALRMGALRRNFLFGAMVFSFLAGFVLILLTNLWHFVDIGLLAIRGISLPWTLQIGPLRAAGLALVSALAGCFLGAVSLRGFRGGGWVIAACMLLPTYGWLIIHNAMEPDRTDGFARMVQGVAHSLGSLPAFAGWLLGAAALLAMALGCWLLVRRVAVHD